MAHEHTSGLANAYDRSASRPNDARVVVPEGAFAQGAEINELQSIAERRGRRIGDMVATDGGRVDGAEIVLTRASAEATTMTATLAAGSIYARGDVRTIEAATIAGLPVTGTVSIGIRIVTALVTWEDDPSLVGLGVGTDGEGEAGAAREVETAVWAREGDGGSGDYFAVYAIRDGAVIDQTVAPDLSGVRAIVAGYDWDAHGHYIVSGCEVTALGLIGSDQVFSVQPGVANIRGWKRTRSYALRHAEPEAPDLETISAETHLYPSVTPAVITLRRPPAASITQVVVQKRVTETVVRGSVPGGIDALGHGSVVAIESVVQGGTTYGTTTYSLASDGVSWAPAGAEPAASSTYQVTYRYNAAVTPTAITPTTITVEGGVAGTQVLVTYRSKLPRTDLLCLTQEGETAYVAGVSARKGAVPPIAPTSLLALAEITNDWLDRPKVKNNGVHSIGFALQSRFNNRIVDVLDVLNAMALEHDARGRSSSIKGLFVDPLTDDYGRDQGEPQTAAIVDGCLVLAVDLVGTAVLGSGAYTLPWVEEIVVEQLLASSAMKINPYANFARMPSDLRLEPAVDFWTSRVTEWTSAATAEFTTVTDSVPPGTVTSATVITEVTGERTEVATLLRQIDVQATIEGFLAGEHLSALTFDGVSILPSPAPTADGDGKIVLTFEVPPGIPTGTRLVRAIGAAGSRAEALFVGAGTIDVDTLRQVTLVTRAVQATVVNVTNVTNVTTVTDPMGPIDNGTNGGEGTDPLGQTWLLSTARQIVGADVRLAALGDRDHGLRLQMAGASNGQPSTEILAQDYLPMATPAVGDWLTARWAVPVHVPAIAERSIVVLTDDDAHALSIARLGDVIDDGAGGQTVVAAQPSNVGVLLSSSNRRTWTPHNDADLTHRIVAARYTATERLVVLGTVALVNVSDLVIRAAVELPTDECSVTFEVVRASGDVIVVAADQTIEWTEYVTETVTIRARLRGTATLSPILWPGVTVCLGRIRASGTYVSKVFGFKAAPSTLRALAAAYLPSGATLTAAWDAADGSWTGLTLAETETLDAGWTEPAWTATGVTALSGRIRLTLSGGPAARPLVARPRAYTI